jgi:hypothetical protein
MAAANDNEHDETQLWFICDCGSPEFHVRYEDGKHWLFCANCETDHTEVFYG